MMDPIVGAIVSVWVIAFGLIIWYNYRGYF